MHYKKCIRRKAIKIQNSDSKGGGKIRSISEAIAAVEKPNDNERSKIR
jgi:hypothetical protein